MEVDRYKMAQFFLCRSAELLQLKALVRALPVVEGEIEVAGRFIHEKYPTLSWPIVSTGSDDFSVAIADLLRYRRTLPATPTERGEDHSGDDTDMVQKGGGDGEGTK